MAGLRGTRGRITGALGLVGAALLAATVSAQDETPLEVEVTAEAERTLRPGLDRLRERVSITCSDGCLASLRGEVVVERSGAREFRLRLRGAERELEAETPASFRTRLSGKETRRLQSALDERGTVARADFAVEASGTEKSGSGEASSALRPGFGLIAKRVRPRLAFFDAKRSARLRFRFRAADTPTVRVEVRRGPATVRRWKLDPAKPFSWHAVRWNGLRRNGAVARDGTYSFWVKGPGARFRRVGAFKLRGHVFPVPGPHGTRGSIGEFGAGRTGGRRHEGFDITAACGSRLVAARGGRVVRRAFDPVLYGWIVEIRARKSDRRLFYSHLRLPPPVTKGERVRTGQRVGEVGQTGNAASTPCHLHFEIRQAGRAINPRPELTRWDRWS